ncbi:DUF3833 domain-containing protein [Kiloniella sp. b19]|uniref:DUF3833 domain-containing protein n=1 Tax=Kiloniella sp. GXU_MW_B19 TaxID=3141326 RepID=UPI0031D1C8CE
MRRVFLFFVPLLLVLAGCSSMKVEDFKSEKPELDLFEYFEGETVAWGWFEDRFGTVKRQFRVDITGTVSNSALTLDEDFFYRDGERSQRVWTITRDGTNGYIGTAADIVGEARGTVSGNALNWKYTLALPVGGSVYHVDFDDWMFLQDGGVLMNRAIVTKWGFEVGRVSLVFQKQQSLIQAAQ